MPWVYLITAGIFECLWATAMKLSDGFSKAGFTAITIAGMIVSFGALVLATKSLPISLAYPIWTGIGAVGTVLVGAFIFKDSISPVTWIFVILLIISIIGIKLTSGQ